MRVPFRPTLALPLMLLCCLAGGSASAQSQLTAAEQDRAQRHESPDWKLIEPYLPDMTTASAERLETQADVLRARRFEEDALEYYTASMQRGGNAVRLTNKVGVTELSLRHADLARAAFLRALAMRPKDPEAWNNLGATEYFAGNYVASVKAYHRAIQLNKRNAVFHSNLATAYFEMKDYESARQHFQLAFKLNPGIFEQVSTGGLEARMLTATDRGRFCFELARIAAEVHDDEAVWRWLRKAIDAGFDIGYEMKTYAAFTPYQHNPQLAQLIANAHALRANRVASSMPVTPLAD